MLPDAGGIFDQDEQIINRLLVIFNHLEDWRKIEMDKPPKEPAPNQ